jgi:hypothetical protein
MSTLAIAFLELNQANQALYKQAKASFHWTTDKPTKPGLYWIRDRNRKVKGVIKVYERVLGELVAVHPGCDSFNRLWEFYEFQGPIEPFGGF